MMCPTIGIHPNGTYLEINDPLLSWWVIPPAVIIAILLFMILSFLTSHLFASSTNDKMKKQEVL